MLVVGSHLFRLLDSVVSRTKIIFQHLQFAIGWTDPKESPGTIAVTFPHHHKAVTGLSDGEIINHPAVDTILLTKQQRSLMSHGSLHDVGVELVSCTYEQTLLGFHT